MIKEAYERLSMDVTEFDVEDVITTSGIGPGGGGDEPSTEPTQPLDPYDIPFPLRRKVLVGTPRSFGILGHGYMVISSCSLSKKRVGRMGWLYYIGFNANILLCLCPVGALDETSRHYNYG